MDSNTLQKLSYGLFVLTASENGKENGCIINTVMQVTSEPKKICIVVNKENLTHDMVMNTKKFTVSIISEDGDFELFKRFGFQSGRNVDKFEGFRDFKKGFNGTNIITKGTNGYISGWVQESIDLGTHTMFIAAVTDMKTLSNVPSVTYTYYQNNIKPKPQKVGVSEEGKTIWRCMVCGYEYVGEELPENFICPICKHPAEDFEKVTG